MPHSFPRPNDLDWTPKAFVSCVSDEFKAERLAITAWLQRNHVVLDSDDVLPLVQENFPKSTGDDLLSLIHEYIKKSDVVIHLVGVKAGFLNEGKTDYERASAAEITNLRKSLQDEMSKLDPQPVWEELSYTQWEAWLAVLYNRPLFVYDLSKGQVKPVRTIHIDLDRIPDVASKGLASQQNHIGQLIQHRTIGSSSISISDARAQYTNTGSVRRIRSQRFHRGSEAATTRSTHKTGRRILAEGHCPQGPFGSGA